MRHRRTAPVEGMDDANGTPAAPDPEFARVAVAGLLDRGGIRIRQSRTMFGEHVDDA